MGEGETRPARIKRHLKENKKTYFVGAGCFAGGVVVAYQAPAARGVIRNIGMVVWKPTNTITQIVLPANGDPGNVVQNLATKEVWASQGALARALGLHPATVSAYFQGRIPDLKGEHYVILGKAGHELL